SAPGANATGLASPARAARFPLSRVQLRAGGGTDSAFVAEPKGRHVSEEGRTAYGTTRETAKRTETRRRRQASNHHGDICGIRGSRHAGHKARRRHRASEPGA